MDSFPKVTIIIHHGEITFGCALCAVFTSFLRSFHLISFRFVSFRFVSSRLVSSRLVSFRFVYWFPSVNLRIAQMYIYVHIYVVHTYL